MKAIKIEMIMDDNASTEHFITQILPKLKEEQDIKQVFWQKCEYSGK